MPRWSFEGVKSAWQEPGEFPCRYCGGEFTTERERWKHWDHDRSCKALRITTRKRKYRYAKKPPRLGPR